MSCTFIHVACTYKIKFVYTSIYCVWTLCICVHDNNKYWSEPYLLSLVQFGNKTAVQCSSMRRLAARDCHWNRQRAQQGMKTFKTRNPGPPSKWWTYWWPTLFLLLWAFHQNIQHPQDMDCLHPHLQGPLQETVHWRNAILHFFHETLL